jgi:ATP-dependent RNA helicase DDX46/PRP5
VKVKVASSDKAETTPEVSSPKDIELTSAQTSKFDPKAIADKHSHKTNSWTTLDGELAKTITVARANVAKVDLKTGMSRDLYSPPSFLQKPFNLSIASISAQPLKAGGNVSSFGLKGKVQPASDSATTKKSLFDDDEVTLERKFEKLPDFVPDEQILEDADMSDAGSDADSDNEEAAAARLAAVEKRRDEQTNGDVEMEEAPSAPADSAMTDNNMHEDDDIDPLDVYMKELETGEPETKSSKQQAEAIYASDDDVTMEATEGLAGDLVAVAKKKKKEVPTVDHSKIAYEPFRKNFYLEPAELKEITIEELADLRLELDGIVVRGNEVPKPVQNWAQMSLSLKTLDVLRDDLKYKKPTAIQAQAIPTIMSGRDVISVAKTGSGKTLAFGIPVLRHILDQRDLGSSDGPIALVLAPTRELAIQIERELSKFLKAHKMKAVSCYGGVPIRDDIANIKRGGNHVMVATPGRLIDLLSSNSGRVLNLRRVTYVVLDEADRMFDMGFEPQVMKIFQNIRPDRQTVLFSATFPQKMEALAKKVTSKTTVVEIVVGGRSTVPPEIKQIIKIVAPDKKFHEILLQLGNLFEADEDARALIFVEKQETAEDLLAKVMKKGYPARSIHGAKEQIDREDAIKEFSAGVVPVIIATSIAARGLDVKQLKLVIQFDPPSHLEDYVHRCGRTGRAGETGTAVTIVTPEQEKEAVHIAKALAQSGQDIPPELQKMVDSYMEKLKNGTVKWSGSGFGGKGLERLDMARESERMREKRAYKTGDEPDEEAEKEKVSEDDDFIVSRSANPEPAQPVAQPQPSSASMPSGLPDLNAEIIVYKTEKPVPGAAGGNSMEAVKRAAEAIGGRLTKKNMIHPGQPIDNKGPDAGAFHATLEINDFPQKARWAVTNRTNVAKILDQTGTSITTKGNYYGPGKVPQEGEMPKLYILV